MGDGEEDKADEERSPLHGELLEAILSHVPLIYLLPASQVSKTWQYAISSSSSPVLFNSHVSKPWLIFHVQNPRNHSAMTTHAYDPNSRVWMDITRAETHFTSPVRSSSSSLLYMLIGPSKLAVSFDALNDTWQFFNGPSVWRYDPIVALVGDRVIVAGGTCDFEDDPLAVEAYDIKSGRWDTCQPMPPMFKDSASATWLSVATWDDKMFVLEKSSGKFCSFDSRTNTWDDTFDLRPNSSICFSVIGSLSRGRLILVGLIGDIDDIESLRLWEVNCDTYDYEEIAKMPTEMLENLVNADSLLSSINISSAEDFIYIYNPSNPKEIFFCELSNDTCQWGSIRNSIINDRNWMDRFIFTCSKVGFNDLQKISMSGRRTFTIKSAEQ